MADSLEKFVETVSGTSHLRVEHDFGDGYVRLQTSEAERRQAAQDIRCSEDIVLEMLRNSRDAHASHVFVAVSREGDKRRITVIDDGCGIPEAMHGLVFEPRVTSKLDTSHMDAWGLHGRGMALFSIAENAEKAYVVDSAPELGCSIHVETNTSKLSEKTDQSTFPTFELSEGNEVKIRGPKNILRTICEFAIESRSQCSVFVGSQAEVVSTLYAYGVATLPVIDRLFGHDEASIPLAKRLALSGDPASLSEGAARIGLEISERTARRILDGEIDDLDPVLNQITLNTAKKGPQSKKAKNALADARGFKLMPQDAEMLADSVQGAYQDLAERYYLAPNVKPFVKGRRDRITLTIPIVRRP